MYDQRLINLRTELNCLSANAHFIEIGSLTDIVQRKLKELSIIRDALCPIIAEPIEHVAPVIDIPEISTSHPVYTRRAKQVSSNTSYNPERYTPYKVLWAKVIIRAAYDYALWKDSRDIRLRKCAQEAEQWLFEPSSLELGFENICFAFDFPVERIRYRTRSLTRDDVKKLEFLERHTKNDIAGETQNGGVE